MIRLLGIYFPLVTTWIFCQQTEAQSQTTAGVKDAPITTPATNVEIEHNGITNFVTMETTKQSSTTTGVLLCHCYKVSDDGASYRGVIATTENGNPCQKWSEQSPHQHSRTPANFPLAGLDNNYCRNPDNEERPWCYTTSLKSRWEYCIVPQCPETTSQQTDLPTTIVSNSTAEKGCYSFFDYGSGYRGNVSVTVSGRRCQNWNSQYPHVHSRTPKNYQYMDLGKNYCRNPIGRNFDLGVWCYTTDPNKEWELCDVPQCERCFDPTNSGASYRGSVAHSKSCSTCQYWSSQSPHRHTRTASNYPNSDLQRNYCRNPDGKEAPWCYTLSSTRWEYCPVEACPVACYDTFDSGATYRGTISQTETGIQCQEWSSQSPHDHGRTPHNYPRSGLTSNYCRNPDGSKRLWCYTTDPNVIWEYCDIPKCGGISPHSL